MIYYTVHIDNNRITVLTLLYLYNEFMPVFIDIYWYLLIFTDIYWYLLIFTDIYWYLLIFTDILRIFITDTCIGLKQYQ